MGATSAAYPEWLQASLLVAAIWSASNAYYTAASPAKPAWYGVSVVAFTWCVLTKFNGVVFAAAYLLPLLAERVRLSRKLLCLAIGTLMAALNVAVYLSVFHRPSTGTSRLTADTGWVLLTKTEHVYDNTLSADAGPHTKRWLVLASRLPRRYDVAGAELFRAVDAIPTEIRARYRALFDQVTGADERTLDDMLAGARLPEGFSVGLSVIPVCYFVGLFEASDLGVRVAMEAVRARPAVYLRNVLAEVWRALRIYRPYASFPRRANMDVLGFSAAQPHGWGVVRLRQPAVLPAVPYGYDKPLVWWPGVRLFDWLASLTIPAWAATACVLAAISAAMVSVVRRGLDAPAAIVITLGVSLAVFLVASSATLEFRWKEFCFVMPIVSTLAVVGVGGAVAAAKALLGRITPA
jgi:hypothetical protein